MARRREHQEKAINAPAESGRPTMKGDLADRMMRREMVHDRRVTKQTLRKCMEWDESHWPQSIE